MTSTLDEVQWLASRWAHFLVWGKNRVFTIYAFHYVPEPVQIEYSLSRILSMSLNLSDFNALSLIRSLSRSKLSIHFEGIQHVPESVYTEFTV